MPVPTNGTTAEGAGAEAEASASAPEQSEKEADDRPADEAPAGKKLSERHVSISVDAVEMSGAGESSAPVDYEPEGKTANATMTVDGKGGSSTNQSWAKNRFFRSTSMLAADLWHPVPQVAALVVNAIKDLKQSAAEVLRLKGIEIHTPVGSELQIDGVVLIIQAPSLRLHRCRKWKSRMDLGLSTPGPCFRSKETNNDVRVSRLQRRSGQLKIIAKILGTRKLSKGRHRTSSKKKPTKPLAKLTATVPMFLNERKEIKIEFTPVDAKGKQLHHFPLSGNHTKEDCFHGYTKLSVLEAAEVFDVKRCRPTRLLGYDEWRPNTVRLWRSMWKSPWRNSDATDPSALLFTMTTDMKHDAVLMYQTMFSQSARVPLSHPELTKEEADMYDKRVLFLKRLFLCFAVCKLTYTIESNGAATHAWKFPLASALCHGNRVLIRLDGVRWQEFLNYLLLGATDAHEWFEDEHSKSEGVPPPLRARAAATHAVHLQPSTSQLIEEKLKVTSVSQTARNLRDGRTCHHLGLNLPIGGFGNQVPSGKGDQLWIGQAGVPYRLSDNNTAKYLDEIQHGHMYIRWDDFGVTQVPVMREDNSGSSIAGAGTQSYSTIAESVSGGTMTPSLISVAELPSNGSAEPPSNGTVAGAEPSKDSNGIENHEKIAQEATTPPIKSVDIPAVAGRAFRASINAAQYAATSSASAAAQTIGMVQDASYAAGSAAKTVFKKVKEHWLHLPQMHTMGDLEAILKDFGYHQIHDSDQHKMRLFRHIVEDNELSLALNQDHKLRCRGVLIHLFIERENEDGTREVLLQEEACALADDDIGDDEVMDGEASLFLSEANTEGTATENLSSGPSAKSMDSASFEGSKQLSSKSLRRLRRQSKTIGSLDAEASESGPQSATHRLEDRCIPTMLRRRHESWTEAVSRLCQSLDIGGKAIEIVIDTCRDNEDDMCIYKCEKPSSHCHHLQPPFSIEYQAYRFKFTMKHSDHHHFKTINKDTFTSVEKGVDLDGFAGHYPTTGTIWRQWRWTPLHEATSKGGALGLFPPEERVQIARETAHLGSILLGIESSAPHKENFFGDKHNAAAKSKDVSPFGTRKWRDYREGGQEVPADIGGMHVSVDTTAFKAMQNLCAKANLSRPSEGYTSGEQGIALRAEKDLFKELLQASDEDIGDILYQRLGVTRPVLHGHAGTLVFDTFVRDRTSLEDADGGLVASTISIGTHGSHLDDGVQASDSEEEAGEKGHAGMEDGAKHKQDIAGASTKSYDRPAAEEKTQQDAGDPEMTPRRTSI